jgi:hypothetical protein
VAAGKRQSEKLLRVTLISFAMTASVIQSENGGNLIKLGARTLPPQPRQCAPFLHIPQIPNIAYHRVVKRMLGEAETDELSPFTGRVRRLGGGSTGADVKALIGLAVVWLLLVALLACLVTSGTL